MGRLRFWLGDWLTWAVTWTLVAQAPLWLGVSLDARRELTEPTLDAIPVADRVPGLAGFAAAGVFLGLVLVLAAVAGAPTRRPGLLVGSVGLGAGSAAFAAFPEGVTGEWYVGLTALAAGLALLAAILPSGESGGTGTVATAPLVLPGAALVLSGLFAAWTCWHGASYWDWRGRSALGYEVGLVLAAALVLLGLTLSRWQTLAVGPLRWLVVAAAVPGVLWALAGASYLLERGTLYRWEEIESPWDFGVPFLLLGVGLLAAAVASRRRRGDLVAWSLAAGTSACLLSLWQQSTWGSVMR